MTDNYPTVPQSKQRVRLDKPPASPRRRSGGSIAALILIVLGGVGGLCVFALVTLAVLGANSYGTRIALKGGHDLYYTRTVKPEEAQKLADYMQKEDGPLAKYDHPASFGLNKEGDTYQFRMVIQSGKENDPAVQVGALAWSVLISTQVFDGAPVDVQLCDQSFKVLKEVKGLHNASAPVAQ